MAAQTPVGPYLQDIAMFLEFDESGKKITSITEYLDSKTALEAIGPLVANGTLTM